MHLSISSTSWKEEGL